MDPYGRWQSGTADQSAISVSNHIVVPLKRRSGNKWEGTSAFRHFFK